MTMELVTGHAGEPHVTAAQDAALHAGVIGGDDYVLSTKDRFAINVVSANKVTIAGGDLVMQGYHASNDKPADLIITNGSQGQKRNDIICCRYTKVGDSIESANLVVVKGTPTTGTPVDPTLNTTPISQGATTYDMALYRVPLDGITIGEPEPMFNILQPMSSVWDSLTQTQRIRFDRSGTTSANDEMHLSGAILPVSPAIAVISIVWVNKGAFKSQSWKATTLARMVGWKVIGSAVHSPAAENIVYEHLGKNQFAATGSGEIQYVTPGTIDIFANAWHRGCLIAPVTPS
ncbi:hypothetical protein ACLMJI_08685 [Bifidobacterium longum]|uniref:hypothetical protein n=1 Tax=Bifidobacterium longum TaxID=216816 RepID=UPI00398CC297